MQGSLTGWAAQERAQAVQDREQAEANTKAAALAQKQAEASKPAHVPAPVLQVDKSAVLVEEQRKANLAKERDLHELMTFLGITAFAFVGIALAIGGAVVFQVRKYGSSASSRSELAGRV